MMHPDTALRPVDDLIGLGVFASQPIPKGTVVYVLEPMDLVLPADSPLLCDPLYAQTLDKYAYVMPDGSRVVCWDHGKYVNHACDPNTLSTPYGFEIAVRDIAAGEEITDDYALFNLDRPFSCCCGSPRCRGVVNQSDLETFADDHDQAIQDALRHFDAVEQRMLPLIDRPTLRQVRRIARGQSATLSVRELRIRQAAETLAA